MPRFARGPLCVSHNAQTGKGVRANPLDYARQVVQDLVHYVEESTAIRMPEANQTLSPLPAQTHISRPCGRPRTHYVYQRNSATGAGGGLTVLGSVESEPSSRLAQRGAR